MGIELSGGAQGFLKEHGDWAVGYRWGGGSRILEETWGLNCRVLVGEGWMSQGFLRGHGDSKLSGIGWGRGQKFLREHGD